MPLYPDKSLWHLVLKDPQAVLATHQLLWQEQRDGNLLLDLNSLLTTLFMTSMFLYQTLKWTPGISLTLVGINASFTYRIFFCEGICHIFLHAFYSFVFHCKSTWFFNPSSPIYIVICFFSYLSWYWCVWGMLALHASREVRQDTLCFTLILIGFALIQTLNTQ